MRRKGETGEGQRTRVLNVCGRERERERERERGGGQTRWLAGTAGRKKKDQKETLSRASVAYQEEVGEEEDENCPQGVPS